ncbi:MAG: hypothetical protein HZA15_03590 [Nitrospirae bacterium]|nr:hypothetical protein [Nitrospirota bacterium]
MAEFQISNCGRWASFGKLLTDEERMRSPGTFGQTEEINYYAVQHYSDERKFIGQWPEDNRINLPANLRDKIKSLVITRFSALKENVLIETRDNLIRPIRIASDDSGNVYMADYAGNKVISFDPTGNVLSAWRLKQYDGYSLDFDTLSRHRGLAISNNKVYLVFEESIDSGPRITEYTLDGTQTRSMSAHSPKVASRLPKVGTKIPLLKEDGYVSDVAVDRDGNLYLFSDDAPSIIKLDKQWQVIKQFNTTLKEGFVKPKPVYDPEQKREIDYTEVIFRAAGGGSFFNFSSDKLSRIGNGPGLYHADKIKFSPNEELYVSFIGNKPFGVIDAMIFDKTGKMLGYWKNDKKSYADWFDKLSDLQRLETIDTGMEIAFQGNRILIGRTLQEGTIGRKYHAVIQEYVREGK